TQTLVAQRAAPAQGVSLKDPDFTVWIGGQRALSNGREITVGATPIRVSFRNDINRDITTLEQLRAKLEGILQDLVASSTSYARDAVTLEIEGDHFRLVSHANPNDPTATAPLVTVTFSEADRTNVTLSAAVDIVDPSFNESLLKDFPNDQRNFN